MKLPDLFNQFLHTSPVREEAYLSLVLEAGMVQSALWTIGKGKKPSVSEAVVERVADDSWERRLEACDRAIARLAQKEGRDDFENVVLGLPAYYLDAQDNIDHTTGVHIKKLTQELELTPIGFVPIHQAIVNMIRQEEGVSPSLILLEIGPEKTTMVLYKVGVVVGKVTIVNDDFVPELERALKAFKDLEVLPSRILLYGENQETLEGYKRDLLKHPWPTRANFIHYPKIEILPLLSLAGAVSWAGASELATTVGDDTATAGVATPPARPTVEASAIQESDQEEAIEASETEKEDVVSDEIEEESVQTDDQEATEDDDLDEGIGESDGDEELSPAAGDDNLMEVAPETLGFRQNVDILEHPSAGEKKALQETVEMGDGESRQSRTEIRETLSRLVSGIQMPNLHFVRLPKIGFIIFLFVVLIAAGVGWLTYWVLPRVTITILEIPKILSESSSVTVNPTATVVDAASKTVPGRKQEKTVSGDKKIAVTGQKDIGDPARGTVTIYNKSLTGKQLKKGLIFTAGNLSFTLDSDVSIASASESLASGSVTYGKANAGITAVKLGPQSNLPSNTEFSLKDTSTSVMVARNDTAFSGGSSKVVTVVSRADYDKLIAELTKELIAKAQAELGSSVTGGERLIDETIKTTVTSKKFNAELDQEVQELAGTITVTITGISYRNEDIAALFTNLVAESVPTGYTMRPTGETVIVKTMKMQKDGSIAMQVEYQGQALPVFDLPLMKAKLAGMSLTAAAESIKETPGVGGIEIGIVTGSLRGQHLPANPGNISVTTAVLE